MDKYIKANELVDRVIESKNYNPHENPLQRQNHVAEHRHFIHMIDSMKAEDVVPVGNIGEFSDGYHTFNELYHHRAILFSVICNMFPERAWKSKCHDTGEDLGDMFIVGIETDKGQATYHYAVDPYWDIFKINELEKAPKWDGHTSAEAIERIGTLHK